jgi:hypothetical protein
VDEDDISVPKEAATERHLSDHAPLIVDFDFAPNSEGLT